jgi:cytochrome c2
MPSPRPARAISGEAGAVSLQENKTSFGPASLALTVLAGLIAVAAGWGRRPHLRADRRPPAVSPAMPVGTRDASPSRASPRFRRAAVTVTIVLALAVAAAAYGAYAYRRSQEARALAVALTGGDPDLAPRLMVQFGCGGCHTIPGVQGANGQVGPPLGYLSRRVYLGGVATNTPDHLVRWIVNPREFDPKTAMPVTGISPDEARHVAAYLYALP